MIRFFLYLLLLFPMISWSQMTLHVQISLDGKSANLNQKLLLNNQHIQLDQVKFYISNLQFYKNDELVVSDPTIAHLVDLSVDSSTYLLFPQISPEAVDEIRFNMGIDSVTNTSGAMGGDLDPIYGMYWSWQSGYINCKIEGFFLESRKEEFQFHIGGYSGDFCALQQIALTSTNNAEVDLILDLAPLLNSVLEKDTEKHVMSPGTQAVKYAQLIAQSFLLTP